MAALLATDQNGIGMWPNAYTWMQVESRSRSRSNDDEQQVRIMRAVAYAEGGQGAMAPSNGCDKNAGGARKKCSQ